MGICREAGGREPNRFGRREEGERSAFSNRRRDGFEHGPFFITPDERAPKRAGARLGEKRAQ